jgi:hypothetical protein
VLLLISLLLLVAVFALKVTAGRDIRPTAPQRRAHDRHGPA